MNYYKNCISYQIINFRTINCIVTKKNGTATTWSREESGNYWQVMPKEKSDLYINKN